MIKRTFGLIGYPLSHSFSKRYFTEKFEREQIKDCEYELFPLEKVEDLPGLLAENRSLRGLNVTIPHKVNVLPFLDEVESAARQIGAVNCIDIKNAGGKLYLKGYNTDAYGFEESLKPLLQPQHTKALIFGNGGAAKAVQYVLEKLNISYLSVVRKAGAGAFLYEDLTAEILKTHTVLINTTPLGMSPETNMCPPIDYTQISPEHIAYDLVYNPLETLFLTKAKAQGARVKNGLDMLHLQAEKAWEIWSRES